MRAALVLALSLVAAAAAVGATRAVADPHPMASGATPAPATETQVAMTEETLHIALDLRTATVEAAVTLENRGPATKLLVGFPCAVGDDAGAIDVPCKVPLTITVDGKKQRASKTKTGKTTQHWTWPMKLAAGQKVALVVRYRAPLVNDRYRVPGLGMGMFTYRLTTGARWAGPIGALHITLDHLHDALLFVSPAGYTRAPGRLTWELTDVEPTEELVIIPHPMAGNRLAGALAAGGAAKVQARLASGDYAKADVEAALAELRRDDRIVDDWVPLITRLGGTSTPARDRALAVIAESVALLEQLAARAKH